MSDGTSGQRAAAWGVHLYTATGALTGFAATLATVEADYRQAFLWLTVATVVDATDGVLARRANVHQHAPGLDGTKLDDIVDYLTYVFVPALLLYLSGALPPGWGVAICGGMLLSSAYGFASTDAKSDDYFFVGFPSYWNIVAVYLFAAGLPPLINAAILAILIGLVFVRVGYVYPSRTPVLRGLTTALGAIWAAMMLAIILSMPDVPGWLVAGSLFFPLYYTGLSFVLHHRRGALRA